MPAPGSEGAGAHARALCPSLFCGCRPRTSRPRTVVPEPVQRGPCQGAGTGGLTLGTDVPSPETEDFVPEGTARLLPKR